ncbi:MAG: hypothetical protein OXF56_06800 [Rhodobacteraceae bacterium]|nr:hypothetical protein [Paracoccaceae bacterium]
MDERDVAGWALFLEDISKRDEEWRSRRTRQPIAAIAWPINFAAVIHGFQICRPN